LPVSYRYVLMLHVALVVQLPVPTQLSKDWAILGVLVIRAIFF
jgi:hypothetical protein